MATLFDYGIADKGGFPRSDLSVILVHCQDFVSRLHQSMTFLHGCTIVLVDTSLYIWSLLLGSGVILLYMSQWCGKM